MFEIPVLLLPPLGMLCKYSFASTWMTVQVEATDGNKRRQKCFSWYNVTWISEINFSTFTTDLAVLLYHYIYTSSGADVSTSRRLKFRQGLNGCSVWTALAVSLHQDTTFSPENTGWQRGHTCITHSGWRLWLDVQWTPDLYQNVGCEHSPATVPPSPQLISASLQWDYCSLYIF